MKMALFHFILELDIWSKLFIEYYRFIRIKAIYY